MGRLPRGSGQTRGQSGFSKLSGLGFGLVVLLTGCENLTSYRPPDQPSLSPDVTPPSDLVPVNPFPPLIDPTALISVEGIGLAQLGMTVKDLKSLLSTDTRYELKPNFNSQFDAIAVRQADQVLFYILYERGQPFSDTQPIERLYTENPTFRTQEQVGPGTPLREAIAAYGFVTLIENPTGEMAVFATPPAPNMQFRAKGISGKPAGIYPPATDALPQTSQNFQEGAIIEGIVVSSPSTQLPATANPIESPRSTPLPVQSAEAEMTRIYQDRLSQLTPTQREQFIEAQLEWLQYRALKCSTSDPNPEQIPSLQGREACLEQLARERIAQLKSLPP